MGEQMDQSGSDSKMSVTSTGCKPAAPLMRRSLSIEFFVGLFTIVCCGAMGWLAVGLGGVDIFPSTTYEIFADFDNISGLKNGASVEIAGVQIGSVVDAVLEDPSAKVKLKISNDVAIHDDDIAAIRTKGIIGDRYIKISRGGSDMKIGAGGTITETESVVDIEDLIGKIVHSMTSDSEEKDK